MATTLSNSRSILNPTKSADECSCSVGAGWNHGEEFDHVQPWPIFILILAFFFLSVSFFFLGHSIITHRPELSAVLVVN